MKLKDLDLSVITKLATEQIEQVTCLECCKYYKAPETARCGHALCHTCWKWRKVCPVCSATIDKRMLKPNLPLQMLTDRIHSFGDTFEKLFDIKLEEFVLESESKESQSTKNNNVKQWLASSENQFSAPITTQPSQPLTPVSTQDIVPIVQLATNKIQVHSDAKKSPNPTNIIHKAHPQEDWDKIETLPETEDIVLKDKDKENIIGPMDIEPFAFHDEYSTENPRRSGRKKENNSEIVLKKSDEINSEKKNMKLQQNWGNVKKMRKEFSKLNKKNKSKLNVSIEMVKKTQKLKNNHASATPPSKSQPPVYTIEDNTPVVDNVQDIPKVIEVIEPICDADVQNVKSLKEKEKDSNISNSRNISPTPELRSQVIKNLSHTKSNSSPKDTNAMVMPFIKKGALCKEVVEPKLSEEAITKPRLETINNPVTVNTDDIEITIKIGSTITNIVINKKKNDVQLKVNTDREIQTSLGPQVLQNKESKSCSTSTEVPMQNLQINIGSSTFTETKTATNDAEKNKEPLVNEAKSSSTKVTKNTASADTATVQFEITESVEREISNIMECVEKEDIAHQPKSTSLKDKEIVLNTEIDPGLENCAEDMDVEENLPPDMESLNEQDIFASGSVKELPIQLLKTTKHTPSEILVSRPRTQRQAEKRMRVANEEDITQSKKRSKTTQEQEKNKSVTKDITLQDSEGMNYDAVMGKVFASIDADIEIIQKSQNTLKSTQILNNTEKSNQGVNNTQKITQTQVSSKKRNLSRPISQKAIDGKYSENLFTNLDKDSEPQEVRTGNKQVLGPATQRNIDKLLTPGVFNNLETTRDETIIDDDIEKVMATPVAEDDCHENDEDVVEETPQKNLSYTKKNVQKVDSNSKQTPVVIEPPKSMSNVSEKTKKKTLSVISVSDSVVEAKDDNTTVLDNKRKISLETPLNINKFFDHVTHKSTPVARKSLNFENQSALDDSEQTLCPTTSQIVKNSQEQEFMIKAFERSQQSSSNVIAIKNKVVNFCLAGSCLSGTEIAQVKLLCSERRWTYVDKYTKDLTHLVVGVDDEKKAQRSVKYMCALAASKWIVTFGWVEKCLLTKQSVDEEPFEALDMTGSNGPTRSRLATSKLFEGITFYCMPPFSVVNVNDLKEMLQSAGGQVVTEVRSVRVTGVEPAILLAEPEHTQEDKFIYLAMELGIVPVNFEWVLNSLGDYCLHSIYELLLCPAALLPKVIEKWPAELIAKDYDSLTEK